ncbi:MAG: triose-phosphate isomerase [Desulfovibrionaceae bacterium]|nr:triose-phosphate isomerase [Desulfovibrionaceae bacterium]
MKKLMAANWKMNKTLAEAGATATDLAARVEQRLAADREVLIIPPFTALAAVAKAVSGAAGFFVGAQDFYPKDKGAFTGEIAPAQILDCGAVYALTGHSERRHVLGETDAFVGQKTAYGLGSGLKVILCVGERIEERRAGKVEEVLTRQLLAGLADVPRDQDPENLVVAYEPVWAIGTGEVAGPAEIVEAHALVRSRLGRKFGANGGKIRILYGGSVKPENCAEIMSLDNVDGVLVGGASLSAESFSAIVTA